jgi:hypothetical protein
LHPRTAHLAQGYSEKTFETRVSEKRALERFWFITSRTRADNPFRDASLAYMPYCTGDVHLGDRVVTYLGATTPTYHVGARKTRLSIEALTRLVPRPEEVWIYGFSAGGFAAIAHADAIAAAFPGARLGVIDDSGLSFAGVSFSPQWNPPVVAGCPACATDFSQRLLYDARRAPERRYAYLSYTYDAALPGFFHQSATVLHHAILAFATRAEATPNIATFVVFGYNHVVMQNTRQKSHGLSLAAWLQQAVGS